MNEQVEDCDGDPDAALDLAKEIQARIDETIDNISECFRNNNLEDAQIWTVKLRYYSNSLKGLSETLPVKE